MRKNYCISSLLLLCIFLICGCGFGVLNMPKESKPPTPTSYPEAIRIEKTSLIMKTPFKLVQEVKPNSAKLDPYIKKIVEKAGNNDDIFIIVTGVSFDKKKIELETNKSFIPNLEMALTFGLDNMKDSLLVKNVEVESMRAIKISGLNGKEMKGECTFAGEGDVAAIFRGIACYNGGDMFSVVIFFSKDNTLARKTVNDVFDSIMVFCHNK